MIANFVDGEYTLDVIKKYKGVLFNNTFRIKTKVEGEIPKAFLYKEVPEILAISKGSEITEDKIRKLNFTGFFSTMQLKITLKDLGQI